MHAADPKKEYSDLFSTVYNMKRHGRPEKQDNYDLGRIILISF